MAFEKAVAVGQLIFKRTMDICGGLVGMLLTGIIFIFVAPIIYIKSPGPIFFKQVLRLGIFNIMEIYFLIAEGGLQYGIFRF